MTFSEKLFRLRKARDMSQEELAERLEVSRQAISRWEMGTAMPDAPNLLAISKLFGVTTDYLLYDEMEHCAAPASGEAASGTHAGRRFDPPQLLLTVMVLIQLVLFFLMLWFVLKNISHYGLPVRKTLCMLSVQLLAVGFFEAIFSKRNMPEIDGAEYHALYYRVAVWTLAYLPIRALLYPLVALLCHWLGRKPSALIAWLYRVFNISGYLIVKEFAVHAVYLAVCLTVFFICRRVIRRRRDT